MSASELKQALKRAGMSQTGDKGKLDWRLGLHKKCVALGLKIGDVNPCSLKLSDLKKSASVLGVSPIGTQDEILDALIKVLEKGGGVKAAAGDAKAASSGDTDGRAIATRILELVEVEDYEGILTIGTAVGTPPITRASSVSLMRKAYLKLSLVVHPDRLGKVFTEATKAFQALVRAFEYLSSADTLDAQAKTPSTDAAKKSSIHMIARSNEGCYRTTVCCPRCKQPWSEGSLDGNPEYFYNFLMTGLKCFTCSTCLFEFGCVTAVHRCPFCRGKFEYAPQDYHRKIVCGNARCAKEFGFFMYHVSERALKSVREEIRSEVELRRKTRESKIRRAAGRRGRGDVDETAAFVLGLSDECPHCGYALSEGDEDEARRHLMECVDDEAKRGHARSKEAGRAKRAHAEEQLARQEDVQATAAWEMLGADSSQLFLLSETQLRGMAIDSGATVEGSSKDELIRDIVSKKGSGGSGSAVVEYRSKRRRIAVGTVPSNLGGTSIGELRAICASHGIPYDSGIRKSDLIALIEGDLFGEGNEHSEAGKGGEVIVIDD